MPLSSVAGIIDAGGGFRVVVTELWRMPFHVAKGDRLFVLPDCQVQEPVPHEEQAALIERVRLYTYRQAKL